METLDTIKTRRSIRKFTDQPVEWDKVVNIIDAARFAPCAGNIQNWKLVIIKEPANKKLIAAACPGHEWMEHANVLIVVAGQPGRAGRLYGLRGEQLYTVQNSAVASENMLLAAHDQGLGSCWVGAFQEEKIRTAVQMPEDNVPLGILALGYPAEAPIAPPKADPEHLVMLEKWTVRKIPMRGYYSEKWPITAERTKDALKRAHKTVKNKIKKLGKK